MIDRYGRNIDYLRLSITERCTLKCEYCRSDEGLCPKKAELSKHDFTRIVKAMASLGIRKIRLTGGEPLLRKDVVEMITEFSAISGIEEIVMTTNAQQLKGMAKKLKDAGLSRLNISIDSLNEQKYRNITRGGDLKAVLSGIEEAIEAELLPIKLNAVIMRGRNDDEIDDFIALTKDKPINMRFIELMPIGKLGTDPSLRVPSEELIAARPYLKPVRPMYDSQPSADYRIDGYIGSVGFISPVSNKFCGKCNRVRVMSDGILKQCLGDNSEVSLKNALSGTDEQLKKAIRQAIFDKPKQHNFDKGFSSQRQMNAIGG